MDFAPLSLTTLLCNLPASNCAAPAVCGRRLQRFGLRATATDPGLVPYYLASDTVEQPASGPGAPGSYQVVAHYTSAIPARRTAPRILRHHRG